MIEHILFLILFLIVVIIMLVMLVSIMIDFISDGNWMLVVLFVAAICLLAISCHLDYKEQAQKELTIQCCKQCEFKKNG